MLNHSRRCRNSIPALPEHHFVRLRDISRWIHKFFLQTYDSVRLNCVDNQCSLEDAVKKEIEKLDIEKVTFLPPQTQKYNRNEQGLEIVCNCLLATANMKKICSLENDSSGWRVWSLSLFQYTEWHYPLFRNSSTGEKKLRSIVFNGYISMPLRMIRE